MREVLKLKDVKKFSFYNHFHGSRVNVIAKKVGTDEALGEEWKILEHDCSKTEDDFGYFPSMMCDGWGDCPMTGRSRRWRAWLYDAPQVAPTFWVGYV